MGELGWGAGLVQLRGAVCARIAEVRELLQVIVERAGRRLLVVIDSQSPASSLVPALRARKVNVHVGTASDMAKGCGLVKSDLEAGRLTHADQEPVNDAREGARKRPIGTAGGWGYDRSNPSVRIHPLVAVTLARLGASMTKKPKAAPRKVVVRT